MSGFVAEGAGDLTRPLLVRDASRGTDEANELGWRNGLVVGIVDTADQDVGIPTKVRSGLLEPRNWHESELPPFSPDLPFLKDRRYGISLVADHEHDFPGWALDTDPKSPFLDDWFYDPALEEIQKSTRIVDYLDPKGRTSLLAQLVKVTDDHLGEYTSAICMGRDIGEHYIAAAGYVWDNQRNQNGLLDTFWITRHADAYGAGREGTPWGILSERTDAHFDWPNQPQHGRIKFQQIDLSAVPVGAVKYKASLGFDPTVANEDSELGLESGQWRPWYHCVDSPEIPHRPPPPPENPPPPYPPPPPPYPDPPPPPDPPMTAPQPDPPPPPPTPRPELLVGLQDLLKLLEEEQAARVGPPDGLPEGRIICLPLSHDPPREDGLQHPEHGYLAISQDANGRRVLWIDGPRVTGIDLPPYWEQIVVVPKETPAGKVVVSDGKGSYTWADPPSAPPPAAPASPAPPFAPAPITPAVAPAVAAPVVAPPTVSVPAPPAPLG